MTIKPISLTRLYETTRLSYKERRVDALALRAEKDVISCDKQRGGANML